ncbi:MAG: EAL domain-containing protein [Cyanobacteria bacterium P01_G01_bin.19]
MAEGIETETQTRLLKELNCEYGQGYLFAKPLNLEAAEEFIIEH